MTRILLQGMAALGVAALVWLFWASDAPRAAEPAGSQVAGSQPAGTRPVADGSKAGDAEKDGDAKDGAKPGAERPRGPRSAFMRAKLASSNLILEGVVTEDFEKIEKGALRLQLISTAAEWRVRDDQVYKTWSDEFRRLTTNLKEAAGKKNLDAAKLAYFDMTLQCLKCHEFLRKHPGGAPKAE